MWVKKLMGENNVKTFSRNLPGVELARYSGYTIQPYYRQVLVTFSFLSPGLLFSREVIEEPQYPSLSRALSSYNRC